MYRQRQLRIFDLHVDCPTHNGHVTLIDKKLDVVCEFSLHLVSSGQFFNFTNRLQKKKTIFFTK